MWNITTYSNTFHLCSNYFIFHRWKWKFSKAKFLAKFIFLKILFQVSSMARKLYLQRWILRNSLSSAMSSLHLGAGLSTCVFLSKWCILQSCNWRVWLCPWLARWCLAFTLYVIHPMIASNSLGKFRKEPFWRKFLNRIVLKNWVFRFWPPPSSPKCPKLK